MTELVERAANRMGSPPDTRPGVMAGELELCALDDGDVRFRPDMPPAALRWLKDDRIAWTRGVVYNVARDG